MLQGAGSVRLSVKTNSQRVEQIESIEPIHLRRGQLCTCVRVRVENQTDSDTCGEIVVIMKSVGGSSPSGNKVSQIETVSINTVFCFRSNTGFSRLICLLMTGVNDVTY